VGLIEGPNYKAKCALGREGTATQRDMCEGDFKTPLGVYPFRRIYYRVDKVSLLETKLPPHIITPNCGWCDEPTHSSYNQYVTLPFEVSHEQLWRSDDIYDLIIVIGHNDDPVVSGKGSAVFIHAARYGFLPTAGCIGLELSNLQRLARLIEIGDEIEIIAA
jgi:L,D-peptidoglycan transpeptidase YkuD (ErfK/YbiS/YcfS/YnhG family)